MYYVRLCDCMIDDFLISGYIIFFMPSGIRRRRLSKVKVTKKPRRSSKKRLSSKNVSSYPIIAENWDPSLTLAQNYAKLGLASKLQAPAGGTAKIYKEEAVVVAQPALKTRMTRTARIVRDADGNSKVVYDDDDEEQSDEPEEPRRNRSQDLEWVSAGVKKSKSEPRTEIVSKLEELAASGESREKYTSERENDWLRSLVAKHGDDYKAMQFDRRLNKFQFSAGDLKRRIYRWRAQN